MSNFENFHNISSVNQSGCLHHGPRPDCLFSTRALAHRRRKHRADAAPALRGVTISTSISKLFKFLKSGKWFKSYELSTIYAATFHLTIYVAQSWGRSLIFDLKDRDHSSDLDLIVRSRSLPVIFLI